MNFYGQSRAITTTSTTAHLLRDLLSLIILFEKKLQQLKCKLAGNQQFHTRLAFEEVDRRKRNEVDINDVYSFVEGGDVNGNTGKILMSECEVFIHKYSVDGKLDYGEFLKLIVPKTNKTLSQRLMVRHIGKSTSLSPLLRSFLIELFQTYIKMLTSTYHVKRQLHMSSNMNHLELMQTFRDYLLQPQKVYRFIVENSQEYEVDVEIEDMVYLEKHVKSGLELGEFGDQDIKELIIEERSWVGEGGSEGENGSISGKDYRKTAGFDQTGRTMQKTMNFLDKKYIKTQAQLPIIVINSPSMLSPNMFKQSKSPQVSQYKGLYLDKFIRGTSSLVGSGRLLKQIDSGLNLSSREQFPEELSSSLSSNNDAFQRG